MTRRRGLTKADIVDAAIELIESDENSDLTLSGVARELGVKPPSLYNHVQGIEALQRDVGLRIATDLGDTMGRAAMGRSGSDALHSIAQEFRSYVKRHPALYELSIHARPEDEEYAQAALRAIEPVVAVLRSFDLDDTETIHSARALRAAMHGFVSLEVAGGFGLDVDVDESFHRLIERLADTLE